MQTQQKLFTNRQLLTLLWPLVVEQVLEVLVGMSDTVMVSSVGEAAISGVSLVDMINYLILNIFAALATGGAVITSQFLGAKSPGEASRSAGQLVTLSAILAYGCHGALPAAARAHAAAVLWQHCGRCVPGSHDLLYDHGNLLPVFGALQRGRGHLPLHGQQRGVDAGIGYRQRDQFVGNAFCIFVLHMGVAGVAVPTLVSRVWACHHSDTDHAAGLPLRVTRDGVTHLRAARQKHSVHRHPVGV